MPVLNPTLKRYFIYGATGLMAGAFIYYISGSIPFYQDTWRVPIAVAVTLIWVYKPNLGVPAALLICLFPIAYNSLTLAIIFLLLLVVIAIIEIWALGPYGFLVLAATTLIVLQPGWEDWILLIPLSAGFLGVRRAAVLGGVSCIWAQILASLIGKSSIGMLMVNIRQVPLLSLNPGSIPSFFDASWINPQLASGSLDTELIPALLAPFIENPVLMVQVGLFTISSAVLASLLRKRVLERIPASVTAVAGAVLVLGAGYLILPGLFDLDTPQVKNLAVAVFLPAALVALTSPVLITIASFLNRGEKAPVASESSRLSEWQDLGIDTGLRQDLVAAAKSQFNERYRRTLQSKSIKPARGILLYGPPGTDMDAAGRVIAHEFGASFLSLESGGLDQLQYDVFVSYSSKDKNVADSIVACLEKNNVRCWYAPRDIKPGTDWGRAITNAIKVSKVFLLVFSAHSDRSQRVLDELNYAITRELTILPFRIENLKPNDTLLLHLSSRHWLDAFDPSWCDYLNQLSKTVKANLENDRTKEELEIPAGRLHSNAKTNLLEMGASLEQTFEEARIKRPSVLFINDLEVFLPNEIGLQKTDIKESRGVGNILDCMDNLEESEGMLVVGATHNPVQVDPQIFSPGRLDRQFYLKSPDVGARRRILGRYLSDQPLALDVDINRLAALTERFTAANVHEICLEAIEQAQNKKDDRGKLTGMADLLAIINARKPTYSDEMLQAYEEFVGLHGNRLENDGA